MPYIVCVSDELALLRLDPQFGNEAYNLIREISSTARAAGIHLVTFTQSSNKRVIDEMIKVNFPGRICFSVPDASSSILFVGDGSAINLMPVIGGHREFRGRDAGTKW
jgi:S-DNA-T family DNA segregation ATPase FtsK/SpoIIIE